MKNEGNKELNSFSFYSRANWSMESYLKNIGNYQTNLRDLYFTWECLYKKKYLCKILKSLFFVHQKLSKNIWNHSSQTF